MPAPILATKLYIPLPRPNAVLRPRLIARLNEGFEAGRKLALISAPAGFGKTTLVSEWITCPRSLWLPPREYLRWLEPALEAARCLPDRSAKGIHLGHIGNVIFPRFSGG